jgi:hypothetical protein
MYLCCHKSETKHQKSLTFISLNPKGLLFSIGQTSNYPESWCGPKKQLVTRAQTHGHRSTLVGSVCHATDGKQGQLQLGICDPNNEKRRDQLYVNVSVLERRLAWLGHLGSLSMLYFIPPFTIASLKTNA